MEIKRNMRWNSISIWKYIELPFYETDFQNFRCELWIEQTLLFACFLEKDCWKSEVCFWKCDVEFRDSLQMLCRESKYAFALCLIGSRSHSTSGVHCHQFLCGWSLRPLTGPCQAQGKRNAPGFSLWCDLWSVSAGKNLGFQKATGSVMVFKTLFTFEFLEKPVRLIM